MPLPHSNLKLPAEPNSSRILVELLKHTRNGERSTIAEIASAARTTDSQVRNVLQKELGQEASTLNITRDVRFKLAFGAARAGMLREAAEGLSWQEFESFAEECLKLAGFETFKGLIAQGQGRKWQVDIAAKKGELLLAFDCKHWASPYHPTRFRKAAEHQRKAVVSMMHDVNTRKRFHDGRLWALPIILTLFEPRTRLEKDAVLVSLQKLADFLNGITQYSDELPFLSSDDYKESPIS